MQSSSGVVAQSAALSSSVCAAHDLAVVSKATAGYEELHRDSQLCKRCSNASSTWAQHNGLQDRQSRVCQLQGSA